MPGFFQTLTKVFSVKESEGELTSERPQMQETTWLLEGKPNSNTTTIPPTYSDASSGLQEDLPSAELTRSIHTWEGIYDPDKIHVYLADTTNVFFFSISKLKTRGYYGLLKCILRGSNGQPYRFGTDLDFEAVDVTGDYQQNVADAFRLFEEWIQTGTLRPLIKHFTSNGFPYRFLNIIACNFEDEKLANLALDECIAKWDVTRNYPS